MLEPASLVSQGTRLLTLDLDCLVTHNHKCIPGLRGGGGGGRIAEKERGRICCCCINYLHVISWHLSMGPQDMEVIQIQTFLFGGAIIGAFTLHTGVSFRAGAPDH